MTPGNDPIVAESSRFEPESTDYDNYQASSDKVRLTLVDGQSMCGIDICLQSVIDRINFRRYEYQVFPGPNSNSVARTLLQECQLPVIEPGLANGWYPGWEFSLD